AVRASCRHRWRRQLSYPEQVVRRRRQVGSHLRLLLSDEATPAHPANGFQPTENLLDLLSFALTDGVSGAASRASIETRRTTPLDRCDVRLNAALAQLRDELLDVISLVAA